MYDNQNYCINLNQYYTQYSYAFLKLGNTALKQGQYADFTYPLGTNLTTQKQCCFMDGCVGNLTCTVPGAGTSPCVCTAWQNVSLNFSTCGTTDINLCW
jgi:hypothetical protein